GKGSSEQPRTRIRNRFVVIERQRAFDVAHERPDKPPEQHGDPHDRGGQDYSNCKIQEPDPERANLKPVMRAQQRVGGGKLDMRNDDTDKGRYSREVGDEVEDIDDQRELPTGNRGLLRRIGSWSRHGRASPRMSGPSWHGNRCNGNPQPPSPWYDFAVQARSRDPSGCKRLRAPAEIILANARHDRGSTSPQHQRAFPQSPPYGRDGVNSSSASSAW